MRLLRLLRLLPLLVACGDGAGPARPLTRLDLARTDSAAPGDRLVRRLDPPARAEEWPTDAERAEVVEVDGARSLQLAGGDQLEVVVPGEYVPGEFNLVQVEYATRPGMNLRVGLRREDGTKVGSTDQGYLRAGERRRFEFDLRTLARRDGPFDELVLLANRDQVGAGGLDWVLLGVRLIHRPLARWLPSPDAPELIELGGQARRGFGLATGTPLATRLRIPAEQARLRLACGPGRRAARRGTEAEVLVRVEDRVVARVRPEDWTTRAWHDAVVDLEGFAGREVTLELELESEEEALVAVERPVLYAPLEDPTTVVLLTSDTHRGAYLGSMKLGIEISTPNLDALAARGVLFEDCFSGSNHTLPSHVSLMTGRDPTETGIVDNRTRLAERAVTLADRFAAAGYVTFATTSAKHMNDPWSGLGQGFDRQDWPNPERERPASRTVARALGWMEHAEGQPLFLWTHVFDVHRPYEPPAELARRHYGEDDPYDEALPEPPWPRPGKLRGVRDAAWVEALYRAEVEHLDDHLGQLLDRPRVRAGIVAFTSDHGEALGEQGIWWEHLGVYPAVLHVPLILAWPDAPAGLRVAAPVRQQDVGRTLLRLAGVDDGSFPGRDLAPCWQGVTPPAAPRFALGSEGHAAAVTQDGWHLVVNLRNPKATAFTRDNAGEHAVELFDLSRDPGCERDLSDEEPERVARLGRALLRWLADAPAELAERNEVEPGDEAMLQGLGYASGGEEGSGLIDLEEVEARLRPWLGE